MALILAIEPDGQQAAHLTNLVRERVRADLVLAETTERALIAIGNRVPDLVLVPSLLSPQEDAALAGALRAIAEAARVQMLTIPVFASAAPQKKAGVFSKLRRGRSQSAGTDGCDPAVFGEQIAAYLAEAAASRATARDQKEHEQEDRDHEERDQQQRDQEHRDWVQQQHEDARQVAVVAREAIPALPTIPDPWDGVPMAPTDGVPSFHAVPDVTEVPILESIAQPAVEPLVAAFDAFEETAVDALLRSAPIEPYLERVAEPVISEPAHEAMAEPVPPPSLSEPAVEPTPDISESTVIDPVLAAAPVESFAEPVAEAVVEPLPEPVVQVIAEPIADPMPEPIAETFMEPAYEAMPEPILEASPIETAEAEPIAEAIAEPCMEPAYQAMPRPVLEASPIETVEQHEPAVPVTADPIETVPSKPLATPEPIAASTTDDVKEVVSSPSWLDRVMRDILDRFATDHDEPAAAPVNEAPVYEISLEEFRRESARSETIDAVATAAPQVAAEEEPPVQPEVMAETQAPTVADPVPDPALALAAAAAPAPVEAIAEPEPEAAPVTLDAEVMADFVSALEPLIGEKFIGSSAVDGVPSGEELTQSELDRLFLMKAGVKWPVEEAAPAPPPPPPAKEQKPEWVALIESLRSDIERLKGERTDTHTQSPRERNRAQRQAVRPEPRVKTLTKKPKPKPIQDSWGLFDPEQCGFAALRAKLDEITEGGDDASP